MNRVIHFELGAADPERAAEFYRAAFGWQIAKWDGPAPYWMVTTGGEGEPGINGGIMRHQDGGARTVNTIAVDSIEDAVAKVEAAGGKLVVPKMAIPKIGWQVYCTDTEGNIFGIHQSDSSVS